MGNLSFKWIAIFSIATNILMIIPPLHMLQVYDRVLASNSLETLLYITLIAAAGIALYGVAESIRGRLAQRAAAQFTVDTSDLLFERLSKANGGSQKSAQTLRDFNTIRTFISSRTLVGLYDLPFAPVFILLMFLLHWTLGLITLVGLGVLVLVAVLNKVRTAQNSQDAKKADMEAFSFAQAVFVRSEDIRAMGLLPNIMERWGDRMGSSLQKGDDAAGQSNMYYGLSKSVRKILQILIMAWGAYLVIGGEISGGVIFAASMISGRALAPFEQVIGGWDRIAHARKAHEDLTAFLDESNQIGEPVRLPDPVGHISAEGLCYSPSQSVNAKPLLDEVSFSLEAGHIMAIIGPSGAGKSTLAKALVGALTPDAGSVQLDGAPRSQWPEDQWGEAVGYVSQEITLFPGTLSENIARLEVNPNPDKVIAAAQAAGIHDMITALPDGYMTEIGPGKVMLSGGQKQRVALARALYSNPRVLILDEPNAHLDSDGESRLMEAMIRARDAGRTVIIVTQRRSVLQISDHVLTIRDGRVESFVNAKESKHTSAKRMKVDAPALAPSEKQVAKPVSAQPAGEVA